MFTSQSKLRYLLSPQHYFADDHYRLEQTRVFASSWHLVGTKSELQNHGDFLTTDVFNVPLIVRNFDGQIKAFKNVCPHRHSMLTSQPCGNAAVLKCQYHGWEFAEDGSTRRIPEAKCFRPWDRENSHLTSLRLESCGDLLFVALTEDAPNLADWLSPFGNDYAEVFDGKQWQMRHVWEFDIEANWKVPTENALDSYHVTEVHPHWFGDTLPSEECTDHDLQQRYTALKYESNMPNEYCQARIKRFLGGDATLEYHHRHHHPNTLFCFMDMMAYIAVFQPTSPTKCRAKMRFYAFRGNARGLIRRQINRLVAAITWRMAKRVATGILSEDRALYPDQQRGIAASNYAGVIGAREERIHHFQRSLLNGLGIPLPADPAALGKSTHLLSASER